MDYKRCAIKKFKIIASKMYPGMTVRLFEWQGYKYTQIMSYQKHK